MANRELYPLTGFHFEVHILDGLSIKQIKKKIKVALGLSPPPPPPDNAFSEVEGITTEISFEEISSGGENDKSYKLPQKVTYPNLVLKRGMLNRESSLASWCDETINNTIGFEIETKSIVVMLLNENDHTPLVTWKFENAYPVKYQTSGFNAQNNDIVVETIEFAYTKYTKQK